MEFEYTTTIYIEDTDLDEMVKLVKQGYEIYEAFEDIISGYDDEVYYSSGCIYEQVEAEIKKRLDKSNE